METDIVKSIYALNREIDLKKFLTFSCFLYPFAITLNVLPAVLFSRGLVVQVAWWSVLSVFFAGLQSVWRWGKFRFTLMLLSWVIGVPWVAYLASGFDFSNDPFNGGVVILFVYCLPVFLLSQLVAWVMSGLYKRWSQELPGFGVMALIILLSLISYVAFGLVTLTLFEPLLYA